MDSNILLSGMQCSLESMLALMALILCIYKGTDSSVVVCFSLFYCIASRQLSPSSGRVAAAVEFLPRDLVKETSLY